MMSTEAPAPIHERIKIVQKQLRIAIQNHQLLVLKHRVNPKDGDIQNHINVVQGLIISMGRTQAELLTQFRREINKERVQNEVAKSRLAGDWGDAPKDIPVYRRADPTPPAVAALLSDECETKKIASWRSKKGFVTLEALSPSPGKGCKSLLRPVVGSGGLVIKKVAKAGVGRTKAPPSAPTTLLVKRVDGVASGKIMLENNSEIKIIYNNKKSAEESLLKQTPKKLQSVLKSKSPDKGLGKEELRLKCSSDELEVSRSRSGSTSGGSSSSGGGGGLTSLSTRRKRVDSVEAVVEEGGEVEIIPLPPPVSQPQPPPPPPPRQPPLRPKKRLQPNMFVKNKLRLRTRVASLFRNRNFVCDSFSNGKGDLSNSSPPSFGCSEELQPHWLTIDDVGQDSFLRYFGLINREQFAAIKKKKCERKRRSVAGQSSYYNDYLQPLMPKRTYSRKPSTPAISNQVVVETAMEVDDEDEKLSKSCTICQKNGNLEVCHSCSESYHLKCVPSASGGCPTCNAQHSNIKNIVGANSSGGSASSMELIKRYLSSSPTQDKNEVEMKQKIEDTLQWSVVITAKPNV